VKVEVKRLDQLGIIAGTIKELGIIEMIDELIGRDNQEGISAGEVIAGMILNGLGFVSRPLMLTPQFFETKPLNILIREGVEATHFNRHKIGRVLDRISEYGCEKLFSMLALESCNRKNVDMRFAHGDTTSYSLTGEYDSDSDTETIKVTYGHSKAKRPDLKQIVQELIVTQDGGVPFVTKTWSGNASDTIIFRERAKMLMEYFKKNSDCYIINDSKMYTEKSAEIINQINSITRVPSGLNLAKKYIDLAYSKADDWQVVAEGYKVQEFSVDNFKIEDQRWVIVHSDKARERAEKTLKKNVDREKKKIEKELFHLQAQRFSCEKDAKEQLSKLTKKWKIHNPCDIALIPFNRSSKRGRPTPETLKHEWQITCQFAIKKGLVNKIIDQEACFVLAVNQPSDKISAKDVLLKYKGQDKVEKGFAFLKSTDVFASSLFLKKPSRIDGLLMIMVLSLLVYSIAQRDLRQNLALLKSTLPNQINKEVPNPTMRWIFQIFEGINYVTITVDGVVTTLIEGITSLRARILHFFSLTIQSIYQYSEARG
jgi:transposase